MIDYPQTEIVSPILKVIFKEELVASYKHLELAGEQTLHPNRSSFLGFFSLDVSLGGRSCLDFSWMVPTTRDPCTR